MLRKVLGLLLLGVLSACTQPEGGCTSSDQCLLGSTCEQGICAFAREAPSGTCAPACAPYEACSASALRCEPRYAGLTLTSRDGLLVGGGEHVIEARLEVVSGFSANYPGSLVFTVTGASGGSAVQLPVVESGDGAYLTRWTPSEDGDFQVTAAYPEAGGPSGTVRLTVDATAPVFAVTVASPDAGVADGGTTFTDPVAAYANAWRRDQIVPVEIRTNEPHLDRSQLKVSLKGTDGNVAAPADVVPFTEGCDAVFCGRAQLDLWRPVFNAFRGVMPLVVDGRDLVGNVGTTSPSDAQVAVTRWKWVFAAQPGIIRSTPAIGQAGSVYFGTTTGSDGKIVALRPDGYSQWAMPLGAVEGGVAVGTSAEGADLVYVGARTGSGASLYALRGSNGGTAVKCPSTAGTFGSGTLIGAIGVGPVGTNSSETAIGVYNGVGTGTDVNKIVAVGSDGGCSSFSPSSGDGVPSIVQDGPVALNGANLFFPSSSDFGEKIASYVIGATTQRQGWPVVVPHPPRSLMLLGSDVIASAANVSSPVSGGVFKVPQTGGSANVSLLYPSGSSWNSRAYGLASSENEAFFGSQSSGSLFALDRLTLAGGLLVADAQSIGFRASPAVGTGAVYFVSTTGAVEARSKDTLETRWSLSAGTLGTVDSSPTLDCSRDASGAAIPGRPGVLYVPAGGKLHAFVVDSAGLDPNAKWPKYQHDVRNTGNSDTVIAPCP